MALTDKLSAIGDAIREKTGGTELLTLDQMPAKIASITTGGGSVEVEPIVLTGDCSYACAGKLSGIYLDEVGSNTTTKNITDVSYMFYRYEGKSIPFEINMKSSSTQDFKYMFSNTKNIQTLPKINGAYPRAIFYTFYDMTHLTEIPEDYFDDWNWDYLHTNMVKLSYNFTYCDCLRNIPVSFLNNFWGIGSTASSSPYPYSIRSLYALDKVEGVGIQQGTLTSNCMNGFCANLYRVSEITFITNEDGTAKTANWKNQTLDLSNYIGYSNNRMYITNYTEYTGITADKEVKDDATYQALKDDPNYWTMDIKYSRYNHDSAVRTINSLPDTSAYLATKGGTNTIKFKGQSGASTDGGAINTLTEEEIAVATAKGWTVSLV